MKKLIIACLFLVFAGNLLFSGTAEPRYRTNGNAKYQYSREKGFHFRLDGFLAVALATLPVEPEMKFLTITGNSSCKDLVPGKEGWQKAQLSIKFTDEAGKKIQTAVILRQDGNQPVKPFDFHTEIPPRTRFVTLESGIYGKSGSAEFSDMKLVQMKRQKIQDALPPDGSSEEKLWDLADAWRLKNSCRETVCLNGLWKFLPVKSKQADKVPENGSGYAWFKVPGGIPDDSWLSGSTQIIYDHPLRTKKIPAHEIKHAWYRRNVRIPENWKDKKIVLSFSTGLQSYASVWVNGRRVGSSDYPGTEVDLTAALKAGKENELALLVSMERADLFSKEYMDGDRTVKAFEMRNRGLTGDLYLHALPKSGRFSDVRIETSVRKKRIAFDCGFLDMKPGKYQVDVKILEKGKIVKHITSEPLLLNQGKQRSRFECGWTNPKLWDLDCPENVYTAFFTLKKADSGDAADQFGPEEFGFREFRVSGRDFLLNETPVQLRLMCGHMAKYSADITNKKHTEQVCKTLRKMNVNAIISDSYNCDPGTIGSLDNMYRISSRNGILSTLTMPHVKNYPGIADDPKIAARYLADAEFFFRRYQNIPGIVMFALNHNFAGYYGDQNPLKIDGIHNQDLFEKRQNRIAASATIPLLKQLDPSRPAYHHSSGNLDGFHTINCYPNWAPLQEKDDWFEHWAAKGRVPLILVEWGMPHMANYSSHRGNPFIHRHPVNQSLNFPEWGAEMFGEDAYRPTPCILENLNAETKLLKGNRKVHLWQFPRAIFTSGEDIPQRVWAEQMRSNLFALRRHGVSAFLPFDQNVFFRRIKPFQPRINPDRFKNLKQPGAVPDRINHRQMPSDWMCADDPENWVLTPAGTALKDSYAEILGRITGPGQNFTEKGHHYYPGEIIRKQLTILNGSRRERSVSWSWKIPLLQKSQSGTVRIPAGKYAEIPIRIAIPEKTQPGGILLSSEVSADGYDVVKDSFAMSVMARPHLKTDKKVGLFDPEGSASPLLKALGVPFRPVRETKDLTGLDLLVCGRNSMKSSPLKVSGPMKNGMRVLLLEQSYDTLYRYGFRAQVHGLRKTWALNPDEFAGEVSDWRGKSTLIPEFMPNLPQFEQQDPVERWGHLKNTRVWRAGNRGSVAGVLPEKPSRGNFIPLLHGGFNLEYAPLMEYHGTDGRILFCQMDLSGRTEQEPQAMDVLKSAIDRALAPDTHSFRNVYYSGGPELHALLKRLAIPAKPLNGKNSLPENSILVVDRQGAEALEKWNPERNIHLLALNLNASQIRRLAPIPLQTTDGSWFFDRTPGLRTTPVFEGISTADLYYRTAPKFTSFDRTGSGGRLLRAIPNGKKAFTVFFQLAPWCFDRTQNNERNSIKHNQFVIARLLYNLGAAGSLEMAPYLDGMNVCTDGNDYLPADWKGLEDPKQQGKALGYHRSDYDFSKWRSVKVPGFFDQQFKDIGGYNGHFWYKLHFDVPNPQDCVLDIGPVDDESFVWLNDRYLGEMSIKTHGDSCYSIPRYYRLKAADLKRKGNILTILCNDLRNDGGLTGQPRLKMTRPDPMHYADDPLPQDDPYRYYRW